MKKAIQWVIFIYLCLIVVAVWLSIKFKNENILVFWFIGFLGIVVGTVILNVIIERRAK